MLKSFEEVKSQGSLDYQAFEQQRQDSHAKNKKGLIMGGAIGGGLVLVGIILIAVGLSIGGLLIFLGILTFGIYFAVVNSKAKKELKGKILGDIVKGIDPEFSYSVGDREFVPEFRKSGFKKSASGTTVDDVFIGKMNGMRFGLGEIKVVRKQSEKRTITVYQGPFAHVEAAQNYGFTSIIPDTMEKALGGVGRLLQKADISRLNQKLLKIEEDQTFEKYFAVWSKDEATTKQILNPEFRSYLVGLATMSQTYVGWRDNKIYFGMDNRRDLFNLKLKNPITESTVRQFYDDFAQYYNILENVVSFVTTGSGAGGNIPSSDGIDAPPPPPAGENTDYYGPSGNETPPPPPPPPGF
ncbi:MAG: DUF3137 domain-containing protein [Bacteroidales bacterium]|nr:DUF3137 domain-containing protein [Bacteroidales bacterium]